MEKPRAQSRVENLTSIVPSKLKVAVLASLAMLSPINAIRSAGQEMQSRSQRYEVYHKVQIELANSMGAKMQAEQENSYSSYENFVEAYRSFFNTQKEQLLISLSELIDQVEKADYGDGQLKQNALNQLKQWQRDTEESSYQSPDLKVYLDWLAFFRHSQQMFTRSKNYYLELLQNEVYKQRSIENEGFTEIDFVRRKAKIENIPFVIGDPTIDEEDYRPSHEYNLGLYQPESKYILINQPFEGDYVKSFEVYIHELDHAVLDDAPNNNISHTNLEVDMSDLAKTFYKQAFSQSPFWSNQLSPDGVLIELSARKRSFEYEFQRLTDWQYGEEFTMDHLRKARELIEDYEMGVSATQLIDNIVDEVKFIELMNTLA